MCLCQSLSGNGSQRPWTGSTLATSSPILPAPDDRWSWVWTCRWNDNWERQLKGWRGKTCPSSTTPTTNSTWPAWGSNPGRRGGKPATKRLSYGTALRPLGRILVLDRSSTEDSKSVLCRLFREFPLLITAVWSAHKNRSSLLHYKHIIRERGGGGSGGDFNLTTDDHNKKVIKNTLRRKR
jgi:hypothetical protein